MIDYKASLARRNGERRRTAATALAAALVLVALSFAACGGGGRVDVSETPMRLSVLVFNVEYGGGPATDRVIRSLHPDVVGVLESYHRLGQMARRAGYPYYNDSLQILSKYPILEPSGARGLYALIEVRPGYVVPFFNEHLDYVNWGPRALRRGTSVASVIHQENVVRTSALTEPLRSIRSLLGQGYPVVLTGDLNEPSSLDYTPATIGTHKGIHEAVQWPVSEALLASGLRDSYREAHPDPVKDPGITHPGSGERIDYVYEGGPSRTIDSKLVGEPGGQDVAISFSPWTSDHRAVLSQLAMHPARMPTMVSVNARMATVGDRITLRYNAPGSDRNTIAIVPAGGGDPARASRHLAASSESGKASLDTSRMAPGGYEAALLDQGGDRIARVSFWLRNPRAKLRLSTDRRTYAEGEPIQVNWTGGPANRWDWLGVYKASASNPHRDSNLIWAYTGLHASGTLPPSTSGSVTLGPATEGGPWPLPPGRYVVHYLLTDRYSSAGSARFTVTGAGRR